jgi:flagellar hook-basal body complex protein FliE
MMAEEAIGAIGAIGAPDPFDALPGVGPAVSAPQTGNALATWFSSQVESANASMAVAEGDLKALATGNAANLHTVMIHLEEARLSFQLLAQVRNRMLEAYQEVMRTQV